MPPYHPPNNIGYNHSTSLCPSTMGAPPSAMTSISGGPLAVPSPVIGPPVPPAGVAPLIGALPNTPNGGLNGGGGADDASSGYGSPDSLTLEER